MCEIKASDLPDVTHTVMVYDYSGQRDNEAEKGFNVWIRCDYSNNAPFDELSGFDNDFVQVGHSSAAAYRSAMALAETWAKRFDCEIEEY